MDEKMIVSHKHRYLFIEIPLTGSWSIHNELREFYGGEPILHKHASYPEAARLSFLKNEEYFVFATVRNPLDEVISGYHKVKNDHKGVFTDPAALGAGLVEPIDLEKFRFVQDNDADFATYFRRYHKRPFGSMIDFSANHLDYVLRFEHLQEGFSEVLERLGLEQVRPLPVSNKTKGRQASWTSYYSADIIEQAKKNFGGFMGRWDYTFPADWGEYHPGLQAQFADHLQFSARQIYLTRFRYDQGLSGRLARKIRATLVK